ncbi:MAG: acyl-ACP--UDP-N-acetylglucosamine O-acyltransferase [Gammaproteobacteria bacterium]
MIDPSARVDAGAVLASDVEIGPWCWIGDGVQIGAGTRVEAHTVIKGPTSIGRDNHIFSHCSLGEDPQDKKFSGSGESRLEIGDRNTIREYCSINRGTPLGGGVTRLGNDNWVMAYCHIAHDCQVGNFTVFANNATLAGHVEIEDYVILGGFTGVHQFCRIGQSSFSAIATIIVRDVPPYVIVNGNTAKPRCINREGLKRRGFAPEAIATLKRAYRTLYRQGHTLEEALELLEAERDDSVEVARLLDFIRASKRGIVR